MRHTKSHTKNRRSHHALVGANLAVCTNCKEPKMRHTVCKSCGFYRGAKVLDLIKQAEKKQKKEKAKKAKSK
jgi:large subunit ribosomal protein L32